VGQRFEASKRLRKEFGAKDDKHAQPLREKHFGAADVKERRGEREARAPPLDSSHRGATGPRVRHDGPAQVVADGPQLGSFEEVEVGKQEFCLKQQLQRKLDWTWARIPRFIPQIIDPQHEEVVFLFFV